MVMISIWKGKSSVVDEYEHTPIHFEGLIVVVVVDVADSNFGFLFGFALSSVSGAFFG